MKKILLSTIVIMISFCSCKEDPKAPGENQKEQAIAVRTVPVFKGPIAHYLELSATIEARHCVDVYPKIDGNVLKVFKDEGDRVKEGEVLASIERDQPELDMEDALLYLEELHYQLEQQHLILQETLHEENTAKVHISELSEKVKLYKTRLKKIQLEFKRSQSMYERDIISNEAHEGQQLAHEEAQYSLNTTNLELKRAQVELKRYTMTVPHAEIQIQVLVNRIKKAEVAVHKAALRLKETDICAPITGVVSHRGVQVGQRVHANSLVYTVVDTNALEVKVGIPERELHSVREGQVVRIMSELVGIPSTMITSTAATQGVQHFQEPLPVQTRGTVKCVGPVVQKETGTVKVTIGLDRAGFLKPGMFVTAQIVTQVREQAVLVPKRSLLYDNNVPFLYLLQSDRAKKVVLAGQMIGFTDRFHCEVLEQVHVGDSVIVVGQAGLKENALVRAVSEVQN